MRIESALAVQRVNVSISCHKCVEMNRCSLMTMTVDQREIQRQ